MKNFISDAIDWIVEVFKWQEMEVSVDELIERGMPVNAAVDDGNWHAFTQLLPWMILAGIIFSIMYLIFAALGNRQVKKWEATHDKYDSLDDFYFTRYYNKKEDLRTKYFWRKVYFRFVYYNRPSVRKSELWDENGYEDYVADLIGFKAYRI